MINLNFISRLGFTSIYIGFPNSLSPFSQLQFAVRSENISENKGIFRPSVLSRSNMGDLVKTIHHWDGQEVVHIVY